jgi:serine/threonine-protein kinase
MGFPIRLFVSHSTHDLRDYALAHKLADGLRAYGVEVWVAPDAIPPGERWEPSIVSALLEKCTHFLVILSESSARSEWVLKELDLARTRVEREPDFRILPLRVSALPTFEQETFVNQFQKLPFWDNFALQLRAVAAALELSPPVPAVFRALIDETTRNFTGRKWVFERIQKFLANERKGYFTLIGDPGEGKTTVLAEYVRRTGCVAHFNIAPAGIRTSEQFLDSITDQLSRLYDARSASIAGQVPAASIRIMELLSRAAEARPKGEPLVVVVDALDEAKENDGSSSQNVLQLPVVLPEGVFLLVSRRRKEVRLLTHEPVYSLDLFDHPEGNRRDVEEYLRGRLSDAAFQPWMEAQRFTVEESAMQLTERSGNNFMYLHYVLREIAAGGFRDAGSVLPLGLSGFYTDHWRRMGMADGQVSELRRTVLYLLSVVEVPVSIRMLAEMAQARAGEIRQVLDDWSEFLHVSQEAGESRFRLYHNSFRDFLHSRPGVDDDLPLARYHAMISDSFEPPQML